MYVELNWLELDNRRLFTKTSKEYGISWDSCFISELRIIIKWASRKPNDLCVWLGYSTSTLMKMKFFDLLEAPYSQLHAFWSRRKPNSESLGGLPPLTCRTGRVLHLQPGRVRYPLELFSHFFIVFTWPVESLCCQCAAVRLPNLPIDSNHFNAFFASQLKGQDNNKMERKY